MSGGESSGTQTTVATPSPEQQVLMNQMMPQIQKFASQGVNLPGFGMTAGFDPAQTRGQEMALGSTGAQGDIVGSAGGGSKFLTSGQALMPSSNPALAAYIKSATDPIEQNLLENTLPAITQAETGAGQPGGTRGEIARGLASRGASQAIGATGAAIANPAYAAGLDAMTKGIATAPATAGAQTIPGQTTSAVGDVRQAQAQNEINENILRTMFPQLEPLMVGGSLASILAGLPGGSTTSTASGSTSPNIASLLGGAGSLAGGLLGKGGLAGLGSMFGGGGAAAGGAGGAGGLSTALGLGEAGAAGAGGTEMASLLPFLMMA